MQRRGYKSASSSLRVKHEKAMMAWVLMTVTTAEKVIIVKIDKVVQMILTRAFMLLSFASQFTMSSAFFKDPNNV